MSPQTSQDHVSNYLSCSIGSSWQHEAGKDNSLPYFRRPHVKHPLYFAGKHLDLRPSLDAALTTGSSSSPSSPSSSSSLSSCPLSISALFFQLPLCVLPLPPSLLQFPLRLEALGWLLRAATCVKFIHGAVVLYVGRMSCKHRNPTALNILFGQESRLQTCTQEEPSFCFSFRARFKAGWLRAGGVQIWEAVHSTHDT